jgi:hypothetical protein
MNDEGPAWPREDPPLERIEVSTSGLLDSELADLMTMLARWAAAGISPGIDAFWGQIAHQLSSVENWRSATLVQMEQELNLF